MYGFYVFYGFGILTATKQVLGSSLPAGLGLCTFWAMPASPVCLSTQGQTPARCAVFGGGSWSFQPEISSEFNHQPFPLPSASCCHVLLFRCVGEGWIWSWELEWGLVMSQFCMGSSAPEPVWARGLTAACLAKEMEVVKGERLEIIIPAESKTRKEMPFSFMFLMLCQAQGHCQSNCSCPLGTP